MQLKIFINLENKPLTLPINYFHILQGIIYTSLNKDKKYQQKLHGINNYKLFCFSNLLGNYKIKEKNIIFDENIFFEIRSIDSYFIFLIYEYIKEHGIKIGNKIYKPILKVENRIIKSEEITIKMLSPICVIHKDEETNKTIFLSPRDKEFESNINNNFKKKYISYYNITPNSDIEITQSYLSHKDKMVTTIKDIYITGWKGEYILKGQPDYLTFLYNTGLGSKNSQGFGLFKIIDDNY